MLLKDLVDASKKVSATTRRKEKTFLLGESLKRARGLEIALAASYLSGQIPQGRLGIGWAVLQKAMENPVERPRPLSLLEVNRVLPHFFHLRIPSSKPALGPPKVQCWPFSLASLPIYCFLLFNQFISRISSQGALNGFPLHLLEASQKDFI
jgi:hypothetical protein